jgi:hypothetical protein
VVAAPEGAIANTLIDAMGLTHLQAQLRRRALKNSGDFSKHWPVVPTMASVRKAHRKIVQAGNVPGTHNEAAADAEAEVVLQVQQGLHARDAAEDPGVQGEVHASEMTEFLGRPHACGIRSSEHPESRDALGFFLYTTSLCNPGNLWPKKEFMSAVLWADCL